MSAPMFQLRSITKLSECHEIEKIGNKTRYAKENCLPIAEYPVHHGQPLEKDTLERDGILG